MGGTPCNRRGFTRRLDSIHWQNFIDMMAAVAVILNSSKLAASVTLTYEVLEPWEEVIMAIQWDKATLVDVARYWVYLSVRADKVCAKVPAGDSGSSKWLVQHAI
ncbi:hypothetical protein TSOC_013861 [Tetrabaena socialis]|uniref:Uncharacterized protein n=1 Tax=Tetrabaena socialis TaxID=47790 RepID=A0A2J7ZJ85_9CHLO|nr:hypothetical protein TSOC_013861 [Tetrabaena socialis]|eukprot:PNH00327.1 hypothetical protein TSOC_013861 [Tetrabaena socialis]